MAHKTRVPSFEDRSNCNVFRLPRLVFKLEKHTLLGHDLVQNGFKYIAIKIHCHCIGTLGSSMKSSFIDNDVIDMATYGALLL